MFSPKISPLMLFMLVIFAIAIVSVSPTFISLSHEKTEELQNKFMAKLKPFLAHYGKDVGGKSQDQKMELISFNKAAEMLKEIEAKFMPRAMLRECGHPQQKDATKGVGTTSSSIPLPLSSPSADFLTILPGFSADNWAMSGHTQFKNENDESNKAANAEIQHLLTWLLSFGARLGYTIGSRALSQVKGADEEIQLERFIRAIECLGLPDSALYLPTTFVADDGQKLLSINFGVKKNNEEKDKQKIRENFKMLSYLIGREKQPVHQLIGQIGAISSQSEHWIERNWIEYDPQGLLDQLNWNGSTHPDEMKKSGSIWDAHALYMRKRFAHGLAQRLLESEQLEGYFLLFPIARSKLKVLTSGLNGKVADLQENMDAAFSERTQDSMHYEDTIQIETELNKVTIDRLMEWQRSLNNRQNVDELISETRKNRLKYLDDFLLQNDKEKEKKLNKAWQHFSEVRKPICDMSKEIDQLDEKIAKLPTETSEIALSIEAKIDDMKSHKISDRELLEKAKRALEDDIKTANAEFEPRLEAAAQQEVLEPQIAEEVQTEEASTANLLNEKKNAAKKALEERINAVKDELKQRLNWANDKFEQIERNIKTAEEAREEELKAAKGKLKQKEKELKLAKARVVLLRKECNKSAAQLKAGLEQLKTVLEKELETVAKKLKFTAALKSFLVTKHARQSHPWRLELHFANVAKILTEIEEKFVPKSLLEQCRSLTTSSSSSSKAEQPSRTLNLESILPELRNFFWSLTDHHNSVAVATITTKDDVDDADGEELRQLLTWLLSFAARMGYTIGARALNMETIETDNKQQQQQKEQQHEIQLENFINAIECLTLPNSEYNNYLPSRFTIVDDDEQRKMAMLSIDFEPNDDTKSEIEYNFKTLSFALKDGKQHAYKILHQIELFSRINIHSSYLHEVYGYVNVNEEFIQRELQRLMIIWTEPDERNNDRFSYPTLYLLQRFGHGLAQRLMESKQLEWYFQMFPCAKQKLNEWKREMNYQYTRKKESSNWDFMESKQKLMHYEDVIRIEMDINSFLKTVMKWLEALHNCKKLSEFNAVLNEIIVTEEQWNYPCGDDNEEEANGLNIAWQQLLSKLSEVYESQVDGKDLNGAKAEASRLESEISALMKSKQKRHKVQNSALINTATARLNELWEERRKDADKMISVLEKLKKQLEMFSVDGGNNSEIINKRGGKQNLQEKFETMLKQFVVKYAEQRKGSDKGDNDNNNNQQMVHISFGKVAEMLTEIAEKFVPKSLLEQCSSSSIHHPENTVGELSTSLSSSSSKQPSHATFKNNKNTGNLKTILAELGTNFWSLSAGEDDGSHHHNHQNSDDGEELRQLLTWLLSFAARMGYTVGARALNMEMKIGESKKTDGIQLEHFITAIECFELIESAYYLRTRIDADDERKMVSISFEANDAVTKEHVKYNFQLLSYLLKRQKQSVHTLIYHSGQNELWDSRLQTSWTWKMPPQKDRGAYILCMQLRFYHALAKRLVESKQLDGYFVLFPGAKLNLEGKILELKEKLGTYEEHADWNFAKNRPVFMHYEDAVQFESNLKEVVIRQMQNIAKWQEKLEHGGDIDKFLRAISEIRMELESADPAKNKHSELKEYLSANEEGEEDVGPLAKAWKQFSSKLSQINETISQMDEKNYEYAMEYGNKLLKSMKAVLSQKAHALKKEINAAKKELLGDLCKQLIAEAKELNKQLEGAVEEEERRNKFTAVLKQFVDKYAEQRKGSEKGENNNNNQQMVQISFGKVAEMLTEIAEKFVPKSLLEQCRSSSSHHPESVQENTVGELLSSSSKQQPSQATFKNSKNNDNLDTILAELGAKFRSLNTNEDGSHKKHHKHNSDDDEEIRQLLTWLLSFAARMGYTVGARALKLETKIGGSKRTDGIQLEHFITAIVCLGLPGSATYVPMTFAIVNDDNYEKKTMPLLLSINFEAKYKKMIKYNFKTLFSLLLGGEKQQHVRHLIDEIAWIARMQASANEGTNEKDHHHHQSPLNRLMKCWTCVIKAGEYSPNRSNSHHAVYMMKRYGHALGQRLMMAESEQLDAYFQVFPGAKRALAHLVTKLEGELAAYRKHVDWKFAESRQTLMHYEDAIRVDTNLKEVALQFGKKEEKKR